jgi:chromodomain-helicase-DNA-binding protein 1
MERIARKTIDPEEYEQHMVAREQQREALLNYHVVERVINSRDGEDGTEYFVKCRCTFTLYPWAPY